MAGACRMHHLFIMMLVLMSCSFMGAMAGSAGPRARTVGAYARGGYYGGPDTVGEAARRVLGDTTTYISYSSLTADAVPCSTAGVSYYDCLSSGAVNPYTRSCTTITLCARDTS